MRDVSSIYGNGKIITWQSIYGPGSPTVLRCYDHIPVDNGTQRSWCKKCDRDLVFKDFVWEETT